jgi:hypothetical protein
VQKFLYTGDDRNIRKVYVAGRLVKWPYLPLAISMCFSQPCAKCIHIEAKHSYIEISWDL